MRYTRGIDYDITSYTDWAYTFEADFDITAAVVALPVFGWESYFDFLSGYQFEFYNYFSGLDNFVVADFEPLLLALNSLPSIAVDSVWT